MVIDSGFVNLLYMTRLTVRFHWPFYIETVVAVSLDKMVDSAIEMALGGVRVYRATGRWSSISRETCTA
jgi:hypothetical protein